MAKIKNCFCKKVPEKSLKKVYEKCKPQMMKKFGRVLSYEEFCHTLAYAHHSGQA